MTTRRSIGPLSIFWTLQNAYKAIDAIFTPFFCAPHIAIHRSHSKWPNRFNSNINFLTHKIHVVIFALNLLIKWTNSRMLDKFPLFFFRIVLFLCCPARLSLEISRCLRTTARSHHTNECLDFIYSPIKFNSLSLINSHPPSHYIDWKYFY